MSCIGVCTRRGGGQRRWLALLGMAAVLISGCAQTGAPGIHKEAPAASLDDAIVELKALPPAERRAREKSIVQAAARIGTPVVDGDTLIFLYDGPARQVQAIGSFQPTLAFDNIDGTDLWVARKEIPDLDQATIGYYLSVDGHLERDTLSRLPADPTYTNELVFHGSRVQVPPELEQHPGVAHGALQHFTLKSTNLGDTRAMTVYLPPGYDSAKRYPVMYASDAAITAGRMQTTLILDNLIAEKRIQPILAVFVEARADYRQREFLPEGDRWDAYQRFILQELMPKVEHDYAVSSRHDGRVLMGISNGAAQAALMALQWPALFRGAIAESPGLTQTEPIPAQDPKNPEQFYLVGGTLEQDFATIYDFLNESLTARGYKTAAVRRPAGHDPDYWEEELVAALVWFFPPGH